jgi:hypothetical protein
MGFDLLVVNYKQGGQGIDALSGVPAAPKKADPK